MQNIEFLNKNHRGYPIVFFKKWSFWHFLKFEIFEKEIQYQFVNEHLNLKYAVNPEFSITLSPWNLEQSQFSTFTGVVLLFQIRIYQVMSNSKEPTKQKKLNNLSNFGKRESWIFCIPTFKFWNLESGIKLWRTDKVR